MSARGGRRAARGMKGMSIRKWGAALSCRGQRAPAAWMG